MTSRTRFGLGCWVVIAVAMGLRLWFPGATIITVDEPTWVGRSKDFRSAVSSGDYASAVAAPRGAHGTRPGVTTMIVGAVAVELEEAKGVTDPVAQLRTAKQIMAVLGSLWLLPFMAAAARLFGRRAGLIAGGIMAVEPLMVGHGRLLHTDGLLTVSAATATLALLVVFEVLRHRGSDGSHDRGSQRAWLRWALLAGFAAGFAFATKLTAVVLLAPVFIALPLVHMALAVRSRARVSEPSPRRSLAEVAQVALVVITASAVTVTAIWPAMWVDPIEALSVTAESVRLANHPTSRLFLGEVIERGDWRFYPVVAYFRASAWLLLGSLLALVLTVKRLVSSEPAVVSRRIVVGLAAMALPYLVVISFSGKQYGRYLLPLLPVAAAALGAVLSAQLGRLRSVRVSAALSWSAFAVAAAWTMSLAPYQISHVDPLVGGQRVAARNIPLGWGEGTEQVDLDLIGGSCVPIYVEGLFWNVATCPAVDASWLEGDGDVPKFVIRYIYRTQVSELGSDLDAFLARRGELVDTVTIDGFNYVEVWEILDGN